jgi:NAD(P)-dependent dehydrogenase (short-subunit alcohol dehydrogenase family)
MQAAPGVGLLSAHGLSYAIVAMTGKVVLITGGNAGLGKAIAIALARLGARIVVTARRRERGERAVEAIREQSGSDAIEWSRLDLASFASIRACAADVHARFDRLDVLVNNAGVVLSTRCETIDGIETTFGVNHLGHFFLTGLLFEMMARSATARIVNVASTAHWLAPAGIDFDDLQATRRYQGMVVYARSKLANIYFTRELATRARGSGVTVNSVCPGLIASEVGAEGEISGALRMLGELSRPLALTATAAAETPVLLASAPELESVSGRHFMFRMPAPISWVARDPRAARRLWDVSEALVETTLAAGAAP